MIYSDDDHSCGNGFATANTQLASPHRVKDIHNQPGTQYTVHCTLTPSCCGLCHCCACAACHRICCMQRRARHITHQATAALCILHSVCQAGCVSGWVPPLALLPLTASASLSAHFLMFSVLYPKISVASSTAAVASLEGWAT